MKLDWRRKNSFDNRLPVDLNRSIITGILTDWFQIAALAVSRV